MLKILNIFANVLACLYAPPWDLAIKESQSKSENPSKD